MFSPLLRSVLLIVMASALAEPAFAQVTEHKLTASDGAAFDAFGVSVSLSGDRAIVGAFWDDDLGTDSGSAYVFELQEDASWIEVAKLTASDGTTSHHFGVSASLSENSIIVGAQFGNSAYVFERQEDGSWLEVVKLIASDGVAGDLFGSSVSLSGGTCALVGAFLDDDLGIDSGSAYVFERQGNGSWLEAAKLNASDGSGNDFFGISLSLSGDYAMVGASFDDDQGIDRGSAYVFERQGDGSWLEVAKLNASDGAALDLFGHSVSLSGDRAIIGATGDGSGSAYVFERQGDGTWLEMVKLNPSDGAADDRFGFSVSLSDDGAIVGAYRDNSERGSAYVFERQEDASWIEVAKLTASDGAVSDFFGSSVSLSGDRSLVGASGNDDIDTDSGAAYVFDSVFPVANEVHAPSPRSYHLSAPYPNPFNPQVHFSLEVAQSQPVRIEVVNTLGRRVDVLQDGLLPGRGTHFFTFDAGSLPSGVYLLRVTGETFTATRTMTLLK